MKKIALICLSLILMGFISVSTIRKSRSEQKEYISPPEIKWQYHALKNNYDLEKIFGEHWVDVLRFNRIDRNHLWPGKKIKNPLNLEEIKNFNPLPSLYEPAIQQEKYVLIALDKQFLGCYEYGKLKYSFPIASGKPGHDTPTGDFKVSARHRNHHSSKYTIDKTDTPYPMTWAVRFYISPRTETAFWIHGRDMPGKPASHGCVGLYDEEMQKKYYGTPKNPILVDAKNFYLWLFPGSENEKNLVELPNCNIAIRIIKNLK